jgi:tetratricopeptide (TPR) repeat protein
MAESDVESVLDSLSAAQARAGVPTYRERTGELASARRRGDRAVEAEICLELGTSLVAVSDVIDVSSEATPTSSEHLRALAASHLADALDAAEAVGDQWTANRARLDLADFEAKAGHGDRARQLLEQARMRLDGGEDLVGRCRALSRLGDLALEGGDNNSALRLYKDSVHIATDVGDPAELGSQIGKVASAYFNLEQFELALKNYQEALDLWIRIRDDAATRARIIVHPHLINATRGEPVIADLRRRIAMTEERRRAADELSRSDRARYRHARHYLERVEPVRTAYQANAEEDRMSALQQFDQDWDQIRQGQRWAESKIDTAQLARDLSIAYAEQAGSRLFWSRVPAPDRRGWGMSGLAVAESRGALDLQVDLHLQLGYDEAALGQTLAAGQHLEQARTLAAELGDQKRDGRVSVLASYLYSEQGRYELAHSELERGRALLDEPGELDRLHLGNLVNIYLSAGDYAHGLDPARRDLEEAVRTADVRREAVALSNLGAMLQGAGENTEAVEILDRGLIAARRLGDRRSEASDLIERGAARLDLQELDHAERDLREGVKIAHDLSDMAMEERAVGNLALTLRASGRYDEAMEAFERALQIAVSRHAPSGEAKALLGQAGVHQLRESYAEATALYRRALELTRALRELDGQCASLTGLGQVAIAEGNAVEAVAFLEEARGLAVQSGARGSEAIALMALAVALGLMHRDDEALNAATTARAIVLELGDRDKIANLDELIPLLRRAGEGQSSPPAANSVESAADHIESSDSDESRKLVTAFALASLQSLSNDGLLPYLDRTTALTGPISDFDISRATETLPRITTFYESARDSDEAVRRLADVLNGKVAEVLRDQQVRNHLRASGLDTETQGAELVWAVGMRAAILTAAALKELTGT